MQPISMRVIAAAIIFFSACSIVFLSQATYTRRIVAIGVIAPDTGLIKIQSPQGGIVLERRVREGQKVHQGDILYVVSAEIMYASGSGNTIPTGAAATQLQQLRIQQELLHADDINTIAIERREHDELKNKIRSLQAELNQLDQEIVVQRERVKAKKEVYDRHAQAQAQGFLSPLALQQKYDELLDYQVRLQSAQRTRLSLVRDLESAATQFDTVERRNALTRSQRERQAADLQQAQIARETDQRTYVTAPQDGVVTAILAEPGQRIGRDTMLTILPRRSMLEVQVMLPSSAIGFIRESDPVTLRFDAFPYQRYGSVKGTIREISQSTLTATDTGGINLKGVGDGFRIRIALPSQSFVASNQAFPLRAGMKAEARFSQEKHPLLSWLIDPLSVWNEKK
jgi:membrane fusion protein